jgi:serine/threonine protein kinase
VVYFTTDKKNVVAFYKTEQDYIARDRLHNIVETYNPTLDSSLGEYWKNLFCWPAKIIDGKRLGIVAPAYPKHFFFEAGPMKGKEKEGKWFASAKLRRLLDPTEKGDWLKYFHVCILISRAVRRMHMSGLAHSDLSYKNVLIDPKGIHAAIIDIDSLVVPGKFPPDVLGTPDFIAPEVYKTLGLDPKDKNRALPSRTTDLHALAVLIYMYLLYRHPLRGGKVHDLDPQKDEEISMGTSALFIEHPSDKTNRPKEKHPSFMPWADIDQIPFKICGPYIQKLYEKAFIDGLHAPNKRPTADQWETDLIKTIDLIQPCRNTNCEQKWFVFDNSTKARCPFCGWQYKGMLPILNLYSARKQGQFNPDDHRLMVYHNQYLYRWHVNKRIFPNEKLTENDKKPVGYFSFHNGRWVLVNQNIPDLKDVTEDKAIPIGSMVELKDGKQILLSREEGGRLIFVQMLSV